MLLSRIPGDLTVGGLRGEKEKRSTRGRLRVDSGIGSFFKLLEVGFFPYLGFIPILNVLLMFRLNEAVKGRLIGPKTWDRIDKIFERKMEQPVFAPRLFGLFGSSLCIECLLGMHWAGNGRGLRVH